MKSFFILILMLVASIVFVGCSQDDSISGVNIGADYDDRPVTAGEIHTEFLKTLYDKGDFAKCAKSTQVSNAATTANEILTRHGLDPMSDTEIEAALQRGRDMAQMDPVKLIASILTTDEMEWWNRFSWEASVSDARKVYNKHCRLYGTPIQGSRLAYLLDVGMSSADFWPEYRKNDIPNYHNPYVPSESAKSWRGVLRFVVAVAVDGGSGALVSGGGPIASGVVGGLASTGADHLIFGD